MSILNLILIFISLLAVPFLAGNGMCGLIGIRGGISGNLITGYLAMWTLIQLMTLPVILIKGSFLIIAFGVIIIMLLLSVLGVVKYRKDMFGNLSLVRENRLLLILFLGFTAFIMYRIVWLTHTDADDSRYVVEAIDILRTNRMLVTDPTTGQETELYMGDFYKDLMSPWAVFLAFSGFVTKLSPAVSAHTVLHPFFYGLLLLVYWQLSERLIGAKKEIKDKEKKTEYTEKELGMYRLVFLFFVQLVVLYGYNSLHSSETFIMSRFWQGKAVLAGIGIPLIFLVYLDMIEHGPKKRVMSMLLMVTMSCCLMSAMGVVVSAILIMVTGFTAAIYKKSFRVLLVSAAVCIIPALYFIVGRLITQAEYMNW